MDAPSHQRCSRDKFSYSFGVGHKTDGRDVVRDTARLNKIKECWSHPAYCMIGVFYLSDGHQ